MTTASRANGPEKAHGDPISRQGEEPGQSQVSHHDHHAEEQDDGLIVDRLGGLSQGQHATGKHGRGANQRDPRAVGKQAGNLAQGECQIGQAEDRRDQEDRGLIRCHGPGFLGWGCFHGDAARRVAQGLVDRSEVVAIGPNALSPANSSPRSRVSGTKKTTRAVAIAPTPASIQKSPR